MLIMSEIFIVNWTLTNNQLYAMFSKLINLFYTDMVPLVFLPM